MTEPFKFRECRATITARIPDTPDADAHPDRVLVQGRGTAHPQFQGGSVVFTEIGEYAIPQPVPVVVVDGELLVEVLAGDDTVTTQPLFLPVTVDERANQNWSWRLTFDFLTLGEYGEEVAHPPLSFPVEAGDGPLELSSVATSVNKTAGFITRGVPGRGITAITASGGVVTVEWDGGEDVEIPIPTAALATPTNDGLMPAADKTKLDGITPFYRSTLTAGAQVDDIRSSPSARGMYFVESLSIAGLPANTAGTLEVDYASSSGRTRQTFTAVKPGTPQSWQRVYSGGSWSDWVPLRWDQGRPAAGTDFNEVRTTGVLAIQNTNHPNQPVPNIGSLETLPASGLLIQRFTTWEASPRVFSRRAVSSTAWSAWEESGAGVRALESRLGATVPTRMPVAPTPATVTPRPAWEIMTSLSADRSHGWNAYSYVLRRTWDDGQTWEEVVTGSNPFAGSTIESVMQLDNGELLVTNEIGSEQRRAVWVSEGYESGAPVFTRTLTAHARYVKFTSAWSQSTHGRILLLNDYGPKAPEWAGATILPEDTARYTHLSMDYGKTWKTVFDLNTYLTDVQGRASVENQHLHGVAWDPYWDRIWVTFGDMMGGAGSNGVVYSDDLGETWETAHYWSEPGAPHQVVGIIPLPGCILFAGDMGPDVLRIDRSEGKRGGTYAISTAWDSTAAGKHLCQAIHKPRRAGDDSPALFAFSAEGEASPSFVVATRDGFEFTEIWRDDVANPPGMGARNIVGPTLRGNVVLASNDRKVSGMWSEVVVRNVGY